MNSEIQEISHNNTSKIIQGAVSIIQQALNQCPNYDSSTNYVLEIRKANILNRILLSQFSKESEQLEHLQVQFKTLENTINVSKKQRRTNDQIEKKFTCSVAKCQKSYASESSLNLHTKLKHSNYLQDSDTLSINSHHVVIA